MTTDAHPFPAAVSERFDVREELVRTELEVLARAQDRTLGREVVLKALGPAAVEALASREDRERALREARALARIDGDGVVRLLDVLETERGPVLVLEPFAGESLAERLARHAGEPMDPADVRRLAFDLATALESVHRAGVVHRGLSTGSVLLSAAGRPRLTGFSFARWDRATGMTSIDYGRASSDAAGSEAVVLRPTHPAPEQVAGQPADARSDVFALGCVLYECLTARNPFPAEDPVDRVAPPPAHKLVRDVPRDLSELVERCLARNPLNRPQSAGEVATQLAAFADESPAEAGERRHAWWRPDVMQLALAGAALFAVWVFALRGDGEDGERGVQLLDQDAASATVGRSGAPALQASYVASHALLIGIGEVYADQRFPALSNAEADVAALAARLDEMTWENWQTTTLTGAAATRQGILSALRDVEHRAGPDDRVFIYYAGHGEPHERASESGWIIPAGARRQAEDPSRADWIRFDEFSRFFDESEAKHILVAMDCCYSGRLAAPRSATSTRYSERFLRSKAHVVITSGRRFEVVSDGVAGAHSPFTRAFLDALSRTDTEAMTSSALYSEIADAFVQEGIGQTPQFAYPPRQSLGQFVFFLQP